jgi:sugar phosphate isomerase/epimerase
MHSPSPPHTGSRRFVAFALLTGLLLLHCVAGGAPQFFVFDNGLGRGTWSAERQARTAKALGFDGVSYNYTNPDELGVWLTTLKAHGLKLYGLYLHTFIDKTEHYDPTLKEAIRKLQGTDAILWITIRETAVKGDYDAEAIKVVQDIADQAQASNLRVALYPHMGFYLATTADAVRLVRKAQRTNVGATLNLCHEFMTGQGNRLDQTILDSAPLLMLVSVNGVSVAEKQYILRLDEGDFDIAGFLTRLTAAGYKGPIGLQCYGIKGDTEANLKASVAAWGKIAARIRPP